MRITGTYAADFIIASGGGTGTIAPSGSRNITVRFAPKNTGVETAYLEISNSVACPDTIKLTGMGVKPALVLSPPNIDLDTVWVGSTAEQLITITNTGTANLIIARTGIAGPHASEFFITRGGGADTLAPSVAKDLTLRFSPQNNGAKTASLMITSNAANTPLAVTLNGIGRALSVQVNSNSTPQAGNALNVSITPPQNFQPTTRQLFFRQTGKKKYDSTLAILAANRYQASIPSDRVALSGLEYYVRLADGQTVATYPSANPQNNPARVRVRIKQHKAEVELHPNTFTMISVPAELDSTQIAQVLRDDYAGYDTLRWRVYRWQNARYAEYLHSNLNAAFAPGQAFWLVTRNGAAFDIEQGYSTNSAQPYNLTLQPGWNQIANPFAFPVAWNSVTKDTNQVSTPAFWNGVEYEYDVKVLQPWQGYFVRNFQSTPTTVAFPPIEAEASTGKTAQRWPTAANEYVLQIAANLAGTKLVDTQNFVGLLNAAQAGRDAFDFAEAPALGDYIQLSIIEEGERFAGNFKPLSDGGQQWEIELSAHLRVNVAKQLQLSLQENGQLPDGYQRFILDKDYGTILPASSGTFRIDLNETFPLRHLKIIVGTPAYAQTHNDGIPLEP
jgi:hypothetical protein